MKLIALILAIAVNASAIETNCGFSTFTTDAPDPVTGSTNWITASYCGLIGGKEYSFSKASSVTGLGAPGPGFTWNSEVDLDIYWFDQMPGGWGGAIFNYHSPGTGMVSIYAPVHDPAQFFILHGATMITNTGPSIVPTVKSVPLKPGVTFDTPLKPAPPALPVKPKTFTGTKGAAALLSSIKARRPVKKPARHIDWATLMKIPMKLIPAAPKTALMPPALPPPVVFRRPDVKGASALTAKRVVSKSFPNKGYYRDMEFTVK